MRCPTLAELPPPPAGKAGWPWTVESPQLPPAMPDGSPWPRISIVTPSYNQGAFIEETIRSILLQGYPALEYIIIDGGSTDDSVRIIEKYVPWLAAWTSEKDRGQSHAINKGLARSTGQYFNWINSDDLLVPGALEQIAVSGGGQRAVGGTVLNFGPGLGETSIHNRFGSARALIEGREEASFQQPGIWLLREGIDACRGIDEAFNYIFDWDLTIRYCAQFGVPFLIDAPLAKFRLHESSKTVKEPMKFHEERLKVLCKLAWTLEDAELRTAANITLRQHAWWSWLAQQSQSPAPRWSKFMRILAGAARDPAVSMSRLTLGALKAALLR